MQYLQQIKSPDDIKTMNMSELKVLAQEIRETLIQVVSENGGHLAPNLGVVELTLALHMVFHTPEDKIIWDVGHQSYVHKLLTGRYEQFHTVRTLDGLSGFPKRSESEHDAFGAGHSSTSISAAVGFAKARDLRGGKNNVIAVIGDGAMTGGMAFEALENAGHMDSNIIVILNDNEMSIDPNVGALAEYLSRARSNPAYTKSKDDVEELLKKIPGIGDKMFKAADKLKDSLKYLLVPGVLFEEFGFKYYGPINGHDLPALMTVLENVKGINRPVLIHVETKKGKGYAPAEKNPDLFHGVSPFHIQTGELKKKSTVPTYTSVFGKTLAELGAQDDRIVGITAAMGKGTGINVFQEQFPARTIDVGIAEEHAVTMAAAMALDGYKPVVAIYSTFLQRAYDQVLHDVCIQNLPVLFAIDRAGLVGSDGETHQGIFDISYFNMIPGMTIIAPKNRYELRDMLYFSKDFDGPLAIRFPRGEASEIYKDDRTEIVYGKSEVLKKGSKVALVAVGSCVKLAKTVEEALSKNKIDATIVNARFIKPIDEEMIKGLSKEHDLIVTMEENVINGSYGQSVLSFVNKEKLQSDVMNVTLPDEFIEHGKVDQLWEMYGFNPDKIASDILKRINN